MSPKLDSVIGVHSNIELDRNVASIAARKITLIGALVNLLLTIGKGVVGVIANSAALIADAAHSAADLISDFVVWIAVLMGSREADENHPYGHRRFETIATLAVSILILSTAIFVILESITRMDSGNVNTPESLALYVAFGAIIAKEILFHLTIRVGNTHSMPLIIANAHHHRSDALTSIAALVGIAGTMNGYATLDLIAALIIGLMLLRVAAKMGWESILEISDIGVDAETSAIIQELIIKEPDVVALHLLKTRHIGGEVLCEVHIQVPPRVTVSAGHQMAERVRLAIINAVPRVAEVTVHVDPEDDEDGTTILATRQELLKVIDNIVSDFPSIDLVSEPLLHMLFDGCEVVMAPYISGSEEEVNSTALRLKRSIEDNENFKKATIHKRLQLNSDDSEE